MSCPVCDRDVEPVVFAVPEDYREYVPDSTEHRAIAAICPHCVRLRPVGGASNDAGDSSESDGGGGDDGIEVPDSDPNSDFTHISGSFPTGEAAVPFALLLECCSSIAINRSALEDLLELVERAGTDPLLAIDRLIADPDVEPAVDLERRRHQLEQLLY